MTCHISDRIMLKTEWGVNSTPSISRHFSLIVTIITFGFQIFLLSIHSVIKNKNCNPYNIVLRSDTLKTPPHSTRHLLKTLSKSAHVAEKVTPSIKMQNTKCHTNKLRCTKDLPVLRTILDQATQAKVNDLEAVAGLGEEDQVFWLQYGEVWFTTHWL